MKKDRSKQKLTKEDFEKFEYHDTRFYGLFYNKTDEGTKVKIDPKRFCYATNGDFAEEVLAVINKRRTHYFYPRKSEYHDYCCNVFADKIKQIRSYWEEHYRELITFAKERIEKPRLETPGSNMLFMSGTIDYDEAIDMSRMQNAQNEASYHEECYRLVTSLYASFVHQMASEIEAVTVYVLTKENALDERFNRNILYATAVNKNKKISDLPSFHYYDKLYCLWNFIKHNSTSTFEKLKTSFPEVLYEDIEYKQGFSAFTAIKFSDELIYEMLDGCDNFFKEYCELVFEENYTEAQWNYGRFFLNIVKEEIENITNPLGIPWYL